jgi:hypothetical protein
MNWNEYLTFVREQLAKVNDYVDRHDTAGDLQALNEEYTPQWARDEVARAIRTVDEMIDALDQPQS